MFNQPTMITPDFFIHTNNETIRIENPSYKMLDIPYTTSILFEGSIPVIHAETYPVYSYAPVFVPAPSGIMLGAVACVICLFNIRKRQ